MLGLQFKFLDKSSFCFQELPDNLFVVAACNPHRSCSAAIRKQTDDGSEQRRNQDDWKLGFYYVKPLHQTLEFLKWDYGALDATQEVEYVKALLDVKQKAEMVVERKKEGTKESTR